MARLTPEQLTASASHEFEFKQEEVEVPQLGGDILLRELSVGRRAKLLKGITDGDGNVSDVLEFQARMFAASCVDPQLKTRDVRKFLDKWPATVSDAVFDAIGRLGGDAKKEASNAEAEFQDADD